MPKISSKRPAASHGSADGVKRRKIAVGTKNQSKATGPKIPKERASERKAIPIPTRKNGIRNDSEKDEEDAQFFQSAAHSADFLANIDVAAIAKSKHERQKARMSEKGARPPRLPRHDTLPSIHSDDDGPWESDVQNNTDSDFGGATASFPDSEAGEDASHASNSSDKSSTSEDDDLEQWYEVNRRPQLDSKMKEELGPERLPVKLADGTIQPRGHLPPPPPESDSESDDEMKGRMENLPRIEDVATGARFGRPAVTSVIGTKSKKARIQLAKEQIASICQDIVSDPENSLGLLRRLASFAQYSVTSSESEAVINDPLIRKLAILSQLAVFKDIVPGYRIRALTDQEKAEKVSQMVQHQREYEEGLVSAYQAYLQLLENELKAKSELSEIALQAMCTLVVELTHFNFRLNLMTAIVARLSRKSWDESSQHCLDTLITVLRKDNTGEPSLEVVRLLNRMIKERHFRVHPNVLSCLIHLRLRSELGGVRASQSQASKEGDGVANFTKRKDKRGKNNDQPRLSKKQKKEMKETKKIEEEMLEAVAEVNQEDRANTHTETLKLLFVLYFRILKSDKSTPLLPVALDGITRFAHFINIDFFRDLLAVLRVLITRDDNDGNESDDEATGQSRWTRSHEESLRHRLQCIVTAFELLSGQGEALTIDLRDFVNFLYAIIPQLSFVQNLNEASSTSSSTVLSQPNHRKTTHGSQAPLGDLLFRALELIFMTRASVGSHPSWRAAAFAKRLLTTCLHWPSPLVSKTLEFVNSLLVKEPTLEAMLSTEDRVTDGVYRPDVDDPQMANVFATSFWEVKLLARRHVDEQVRLKARSFASLKG
ncbi:nucleolar complex-associated protein 3 [Cantharellus anzutake]|uniref:nucleolar complex-associated protein 3 n=1 Tax=Cantharellus anzutake TaxID=1750568 RepID=UPI001903F863|nr:nucleolar complex-associated protein 3 [Cantharellus anzutake]KAF8333993.1 nucleolar complex-associated protein 3 [Cantharellus anzutake]